MAGDSPIGMRTVVSMPLADAQSALLSVYNKTELLPFARSLKELGFKLLGSGGTARMIREAGLEIE